MELEVVRVRLHDPTGGDVGLAELPAGWTIGPGDELVDGCGQLVRVVEFVVFPVGSPVAALVKVDRPAAVGHR